MTLTALEIKDKSFGTKFRGYDVEEVDAKISLVTACFCSFSCSAKETPLV